MEAIVSLAVFMMLAIELGLADLLSVYRSGNLGPSMYRISTFNAALFPNMPQLEQRTEILIEEIQHSSSEVFCLQEIWLTESQRRIRDGVQSSYPHVVTATELTQNSSDTDHIPACDSSSIELFDSCAATHCTLSNYLLNCMMEKCFLTLHQLPRYCLVCLLFGPPSGQSCLTALASQYWTTASGLMLLSKRKLTNVQTHSFLPDPVAQQHGAIRGYIQAQVAGIGGVVCSHLTAILAAEYAGPPFVVPLLFSSYQEQQRSELVMLLQAAKDLAKPVILVGDFNHSPFIASRGIEPELAANYEWLLSQGFVCAHVMKNGHCTWCKRDNALISHLDYNADTAIVDHVYVTKGSLDRVKFTKIIFNHVYTKDGTPLSDHNGIEVFFKHSVYHQLPLSNRNWKNERDVCLADVP